MNKVISIGGLLLIVANFNGLLTGAVANRETENVVEVLHTFEPDESPEGIAIDKKSTLFVSLRKTNGSSYVSNKVIKLFSSGKREVITELGAVEPGKSGILGLATDSRGNVFLAFVSGDLRHGVWNISPGGEKKHLKGSENILIPNAISLDDAGNVYVTDSDPMNSGETGVWRYSIESGVFKPWCGDPLLLSDPANPCGGMPLVAANGITFVSPNHIYVANTERGLVAHVLIRDDGSAGKVSMVAGNTPLLLNPDGLVADEAGNLYTVVPVATVDMPAEMGGPLPPMSPLVKIVPETGIVEPLLDVHSFPDAEFFDFPTSLFIRKEKTGRKFIYVISMGSQHYGFPPGTGSKLTRVQVD